MSDIDAYTIAEVAARLQVSEDSIQRMVARKEIPHLRIGKLIRIPVAAFQQWMLDEAAKPQQEAENDPLRTLAPRSMMLSRS